MSLHMCDWAQDYHTIYKLCYTDLQDAAQQAALSHIAAEGRRAYEEFAARLPNGPPGISLKVLHSAFQCCSNFSLAATWANACDQGQDTPIVVRCRWIRSNIAAALQVVSDIDDTLMSSGGSYPAGRDMRYPHNSVYPGVLAFYNELDAGHVLKVEVRSAANVTLSNEDVSENVIVESSTEHLIPADIFCPCNRSAGEPQLQGLLCLSRQSRVLASSTPN